MKTEQKIVMHIISINALMAVFGLILGPNPFSSLSTYLSVFSACLFVSTILTLPLYPIELSLTSIMVAVMLFIMAIGVECIHPSPVVVKATQAEMGNTPEAEWQFELFYEKYGSETSKAFSFTGTTPESDIALKRRIQEWNKNNPNSPITRHYKYLTYIPEEYSKKNGYPLTFSRGY